jgi:hypothetical protein
MGQWNALYDEILAYYFWEPQHLGKIKNPNSDITSYLKLIEHSKKLEVTLNHQLSFFFSLALKSFIREFFSEAFNTTINDDFVFDPSHMNSLITELKDLTQPDFFFVGENNIVAIEMKIDAKTSLEQYMKYLLFNMLYQAKMGTNKQFWLLFLGKNTPEKLWTEGFTTFEQAKEAFKLLDLPAKSNKGGIHLQEIKPSLNELSDNTTVSYTTYAQLQSLIHNKIELLSQDDSSYSYSRLLNGMADELKSRELNIQIN